MNGLGDKNKINYFIFTFLWVTFYFSFLRLGVSELAYAYLNLSPSRFGQMKNICVGPKEFTRNYFIVAWLLAEIA